MYLSTLHSTNSILPYFGGLLFITVLVLMLKMISYIFNILYIHYSTLVEMHPEDGSEVAKNEVSVLKIALKQ